MILLKIKIRELKKSEMQKYLIPLMYAHNKNITEKILQKRLKEMVALQYRCVGAFIKQNCVGVAGFWEGTRFWCGKYLDVDNVFVKEEFRKSKVGSKLMDWIQTLATKNKCEMLVLDSYVTSSKAHKFYFREGYAIAGYHFFKKI